MKLTRLLSLLIALFFLYDSSAQTILRIEIGTKIKYPKAFSFRDTLSNSQIDFFISFIPEMNGNGFGKFIPEIQYALQSFTIKNLDDAGFRLHYFRFIPQWEIPVHEMLGLHFGVSTGYDFISESRRKPAGWGESQWKHTSILDVGWIVGARIYRKNWVLRLRYYQGFSDNEIETDIFNVGINGYKKIRYKYRDIQIGIGYTFN